MQQDREKAALPSIISPSGFLGAFQWKRSSAFGFPFLDFLRFLPLLLLERFSFFDFFSDFILQYDSSNDTQQTVLVLINEQVQTTIVRETCKVAFDGSEKETTRVTCSQSWN